MVWCPLICLTTSVFKKIWNGEINYKNFINVHLYFPYEVRKGTHFSLTKKQEIKYLRNALAVLGCNKLLVAAAPFFTKLIFLTNDFNKVLKAAILLEISKQSLFAWGNLSVVLQQRHNGKVYNKNNNPSQIWIAFFQLSIACIRNRKSQ